jgi:hypothetical protein
MATRNASKPSARNVSKAAPARKAPAAPAKAAPAASRPVPSPKGPAAIVTRNAKGQLETPHSLAMAAKAPRKAAPVAVATETPVGTRKARPMPAKQASHVAPHAPNNAS